MPMAGQRMKTKFKKWFENSREFIVSLLFPPRCPICDEILTPEETEKGIHLACENKLYPVKGAVCMHCGRPLGQVNSKRMHDNIPDYLRPENTYEYCRECQRKGYTQRMNSSHITQAKSLYLYKGAIKKSMYRFKYANKREYACFFAKEAVAQYGTWLAATQVQVIVPVPMYLPKQKQRGYNQAEIFAKELSKLTGIPVNLNCIRRIKDTTPQKELNDLERKNNLENAFQKGESIVQYSHILVVDDIYTTGYTAEAVAMEMRRQGCRHIYLLSICIGGNG